MYYNENIYRKNDQFLMKSSHLYFLTIDKAGLCELFAGKMSY